MRSFWFSFEHHCTLEFPALRKKIFLFTCVNFSQRCNGVCLYHNISTTAQRCALVNLVQKNKLIDLHLSQERGKIGPFKKKNVEPFIFQSQQIQRELWCLLLEQSLARVAKALVLNFSSSSSSVHDFWQGSTIHIWLMVCNVQPVGNRASPDNGLSPSGKWFGGT